MPAHCPETAARFRICRLLRGGQLLELEGALMVAVVQEGGQEEEVATALVQEQAEGQEEAVALHLVQTCFTA